MNNRERDLDRVLASPAASGDPELDELSATASDVARALAAPVPPQPNERAMFIEGIAAGRRSVVSRFAAPALATAMAFVAITLIARGALPGQPLYPVREVLHSAGLATSSSERVHEHEENAELLVRRAQNAYEAARPATAEKLATDALIELGSAQAFMAELETDDRARYQARIDSLREQAMDIWRLSVSAPIPFDDDPGSDDSDDSNNSGPGSDNSGGGSGD
jgi:hypothetical protein